MTLPSFICVGAPKAATTWLHACLNEHPEIFIPAYKEMHFFIPYAGRDLYTSHGIPWFASYYQGSESFRARGEVQTQYFAHELAPARISGAIPDCRILVLLRNPVDRLWSHLNFDLNRARQHRPALELLENPLALKQTQHGFYARHLRRYFEHFPRQNIHIVTTEEINADPVAALKRTFRFIGVGESFVPSTAPQKRNEARVVRHRRLYHAMHRVWGELAPNGLDVVRRMAKRTGITEAIKRWNSRKAENPPLPEHLRARLTAIYRADVLELEQLLEKDFTPWLDPAAHTRAA